MTLIKMVLFLLLLLPLPHAIRKRMIKFLSTNVFFDRARYVAKILFLLFFLISIVVLLFIDAANQSFKSQDAHDHHHHNADTENLLKVKIFRAQRNMYLTGAVIFLSLVLNRFYRLIVDLAQSEEKMEILKQQAAKTTKEYLVLNIDRNYWTRILVLAAATKG